MADPSVMTRVLEVINIILDAGDRAPEAWVHVNQGIVYLQSGLGEFHQAGVIIIGRSAEVQVATITLSPEVFGKIEELNAVLGSPEAISKTGLSASAGDRKGLFTNLFTFLAQHPELLQLLLLFIKK